MKKRLEFLVEFLEVAARELEEKAESKDNDYLRGTQTGRGAAYELCAKWIREELEKGD